jgi:CRP-like cAMP-binding protein
MYQLLRAYIDKVMSSSISDEEFRLIEEAFQERILKKKQFLLHEGSICQYTAFITKGAMRQYTIDKKGVEHIVRLAIEEWWISDRESFQEFTPSRYNIVALEDCHLLVITNEKLTYLLDKSPLFAKLRRLLDEKNNISSQKRIEAAISFTAEEKVINLIKNYPQFLRRFPQNMLASYLGITPETLSRIRKHLLA